MDVATITALISAIVSLLGMLGTVIAVFIKVGRYQAKIENLEKLFEGLLTHEALNNKLQTLRDHFDSVVAHLHEKINVAKEDSASNANLATVNDHVSAIRTDLEVLKGGVGRVVDTMSATEEVITSLLAESRGDEVRISALEQFRSSAEQAIRELELQLARLEGGND